jgi:hypothetical protein
VGFVFVFFMPLLICLYWVGSCVWQAVGIGGRKLAEFDNMSNLLFLSPLWNSSTEGKEAEFASVSAKDHQQPLSFRVLGQNSYTAKA